MKHSVPMLRSLTVTAALLALANPIIADSAVHFDIAQSIADPMLYVRAVSHPFWIWVGMPLFFLTDIFGWYILPTYLIRCIAALPDMPHALRLHRLSWAYTIIGSIGALVYVGGYYRYIAGAPGETFAELSRFSYEWIWGSLNNIVGGTMFITLGLGMRRRSPRLTMLLNLVLGVMMLLSSLLFVSGVLLHSLTISNLSSMVTMPIYLLTFPFAVLSFWPLWRPE